MVQIVNASEIVSLFGKALDAPEVGALLTALGTMNRPQPDYENEDYFDWVLVRRHGVELGFSGVLYHQGVDDAFWGADDQLALYQAYFYTAFDDVKTFQGELPFGLKFSDSREIVQKKLAMYEHTRHSFVTDTWDTEEYRLNVHYTKGFQSIDKMACMQEWSPIPRKSPLIFPSLQQIVEALGRDVRDPLFTRLWQEEDNREIQELVLEDEMNSAFLNRSYGVDLNFSDAHDKKQFYAITLLGNRQIDSVDWEGELPLGLDFEDSPETLFQKIKQAPDERSDDMDDNTDYALWHFPDYTLFVGYSHLDNRILRVKLYAPGVWKNFRCCES